MSGFLKYLALLAAAGLLLAACRPGTSPTASVAEPEQVDATEHIPVPIEQPDSSIIIHIKDSADYSPTFLRKLEASGLTQVSLVDSFMILGESYKARIPQIPELGKRTALTGRKGDLAIALTVERINQTTIDYRLEMVEFGNASFHSRGQAHLSPHFYLGAETDEGPSGDAYLSTEFNDLQDSCYTLIRIGSQDPSYPRLLAKLVSNCNGELQDIKLDNYPTLVEK